MPGQQHGPYLEAERVGLVTVIRFTGPGDFTGAKVQVLGNHLDRLVAQTDPWLFVLNCGEVRQQDSSMLARLIDLNHKTHVAGGRVALCRLNPEITGTLERLKIAHLFHFYPDEPEALRSFA